jgi:hypothetical protein
MSFCFGSGDTFGGSRSRFTVNIDISWLHSSPQTRARISCDAAALRFRGRLFYDNGGFFIPSHRLFCPEPRIFVDRRSHFALAPTLAACLHTPHSQVGCVSSPMEIQN